MSISPLLWELQYLIGEQQNNACFATFETHPSVTLSSVKTLVIFAISCFVVLCADDELYNGLETLVTSFLVPIILPFLDMQMSGFLHFCNLKNEGK